MSYIGSKNKLEISKTYRAPSPPTKSFPTEFSSQTLYQHTIYNSNNTIVLYTNLFYNNIQYTVVLYTNIQYTIVTIYNSTTTHIIHYSSIQPQYELRSVFIISNRKISN